MTSPIETAWLRAFATFAAHANMSRAARELHVSQPAIHAQIKRLSEAVGATLYRRSGRGVVLTREGIEVAAFARESEERVESLRDRLRGAADEGRVVLAAGAGAFLWIISEGVRAFSRKHRHRVELMSADAANAIGAVRDGTAHVGVAVVDDAPSGLVSHVVAEVQQMLVVPRGHALARRRRIGPSDLDGEPLVVPPEGRPHRSTIAAVLSGHGVSLRVGAVAAGWDLMLRFVELGAGIAIVNGCVAVPKGLVSIPMTGMPSVRYAIFTRPNPSGAATELVAEIRAQAASRRRS